jgi:ATP-dependent DNA helicase RecG
MASYRGLRQLDAPVRAALEAGGRCFVICARREAGGDHDPVDVASCHHHLLQLFGAQGVGLVHGALPEADKLALMADFASARLRVLVSTSVIEVGIDIPDAVLLVVLDAERFGLAQLHQMRGRLGRGAHAGRFLLLYRGASPPERLSVLMNHVDGMAIAMHDLAERGAGELLGTAQHGSIQLRIADLARDLDLLEEAHRRARLLGSEAEPRIAQLARLLAGGQDASFLAGG